MDNPEGGSFSTPLKRREPETRKLGSVSYSNRTHPISRPDEDNVNKENEEQFETSGSRRITDNSPWKRARLARYASLPKQDLSRNSMDSSPAVIEMLDRTVNGQDQQLHDEGMDDVQEEISEAISSAVRDISHSELPNHENEHQTSLFRNLLSPASGGSPEKRQLTPEGTRDPDMSNLDSLTPLKGYVQGSENGIIQTLQSRFRQELSTYEQLLRTKNQQTDEYRKKTVSCFEKIKTLGDKLDDQKLAFSSLWGEHEVLKASHAARESNWDVQAQELNKVSADKINLEERVIKLKSKLSEVRNEMKMLNQNSQILQGKFQVQIQDNETFKKQILAHEEFDSKLQSRMENIKTERDHLKVEKDQLEIEVTTLKNTKSEHELESRMLRQRLSNLENQLHDKENTCKELQYTVDCFEDTKRQSTTELENRVSELLKDNKRLLGEVDAANILQIELNESMLKLNTSESDLKVADNKLKELQEKYTELETHAVHLDDQLKDDQAKLENITDLMAIKSAELEEASHDVEELRQTNSHLEEFVKIRDAAVEEWKSKYDGKCAENNKLSVEIESFQFKNGNLESEHLVELEQLHQQMTSLQQTLRSNSEKIDSLEKEKKALRSLLDTAEKSAKLDNTTEPLVSKDNIIADLEQQLREKDSDASKRLQLLAEDLYIQYSSKHEQKVKMLKKGYEAKYQDRFEKLNLENTELHDELNQLNSTLRAEREEKQRLVKLLNK
ncbi:LANO_0H14004g1_1 [Lachancea nothofagi CBS 11611]|uniref:LANO_0H14004g1_1 n=1 Tax=Lachancea nothofagi CBS 11611 TaxID=1266666 RepID=A0A1G4KME0_9SACH|nr:LANO_0H14004g1_1 [Lachancea nothofagi CBS 11611]